MSQENVKLQKFDLLTLKILCFIVETRDHKIQACHTKIELILGQGESLQITLRSTFRDFVEAIESKNAGGA